MSETNRDNVHHLDVAEARVEVLRLRAELSRQRITSDEILELHKLRAENDWFKRAQGVRDAEDENTIRMLKVQVASLKDSRDRMAENAGAFAETVDEKNTEIDRLRDLLREAHAYMTDQPWELQQRIDAALKEKP